MLSVRIISDLEEVEKIRPLWETWQHHPNTDIDFYLTIMGVRPEVIAPKVMLVYRGGTPAALMVARIERRKLAFRIGYLSIFNPIVRVLTIPFGGLLGEQSAENCALLIQEVIASLRRGEADVAVFEPVNNATILYRSIRGLPHWCSRDRSSASRPHRIMGLQETADAFQHSLSPKVRKNLNWQSKKLHAAYSGIEVIRYQDLFTLDAMIGDVESIARTTYQRRLGVGFVDNAEMRARLRLEAAKGWLRAYVLYLDGQPSAFWLGTIYNAVFHSNFMGYDAAVSKYSPGMFLVTKVIEELCSQQHPQRVTHVDFGLGDAQYKQVLSTFGWDESPLHIWAPRPKGVCLNILNTALYFVSHRANRVLKGTALIGNLKNRWRNAGARPGRVKEG